MASFSVIDELYRSNLTPRTLSLLDSWHRAWSLPNSVKGQLRYLKSVRSPLMHTYHARKREIRMRAVLIRVQIVVPAFDDV